MFQNLDSKRKLRGWLPVCLVTLAVACVGSYVNRSLGFESSDQYASDFSADEFNRLRKLIAQNKSSEISDDQANHLVAHLRRKYPFESIRDRLPDFSPRPNAPVLNEAAEKDLEQYEAKNYRGARTYGADVRNRSLQLLHEEEVRKFVARDGNGFGRTPPPSAIHLHMVLAEPIPVDPAPVLVSIERGGPSVPVPQFLKSLHQRSHDDFVYEGSLGYVRPGDEVAGFLPHALSRKPRISPRSRRVFASGDSDTPFKAADSSREAPRDATWLLERMELVSLLEHDQPLAYQSDFLPRMDELADAPTRSLDDFESGSLKQLWEGESLVTDAHQNQIRMLGAIRASKTCFQCHQHPRGELLGAFTYTLTRAKPIALPQ